MRRTRRLAALTAVLAMAAATPASAADCPGSDLTPSDENLAAVSAATVCLVNAERTSRGLPALRQDAQLNMASLEFSVRMVSERFFAHVSPDGGTLKDRLTRAGYLSGVDVWAIGENIAWGESFLARPVKIVEAWMASQGHRDNILSDRFGEIGIGITLATPVTTNPGATYTTDFGRRENDSQADPAGGEVTEAAVSPASEVRPVVTTKRARKVSRKRVSRKSRVKRSKRARRTRCRAIAAGFGESRRITPPKKRCRAARR